MTSYTYEFLERRGITKETHEFFNVKTKIAANGEPISVGYPYSNESVKIRNLKKKEFWSVGDMSRASGWAVDRFSAGSARSITLTEGEDDAMSVYQMMGSKYPVWSAKSSSSARSDAQKDWEHINSFEKIYIAFDNDDPGKKAAAQVAGLFDFNKVYHVKLSKYKDPHEYLENGDIEEFRSVWYNANRFLPEGVFSSFSEVDEVLDSAVSRIGYSYPFKTLQEMTGGMIPGKITLLSGLEGIGKTEFMHAVEYHVAKTYPDENFGIIHLEESKDENIKRLVSYELKTPTTQDSTVSLDEIKKTYRVIAQRDNRIHFYPHFGSEDPNVILDTIRFLVVCCGCKLIFLDHITFVVTGRITEDERRELDYISTRLSMMAVELDFALVIVSHENDDGKTRGSRNISKVARVWIRIERNTMHENEFLRQIAFLSLPKNQQTSKTGPAGRLFYNQETACLEELSSELPT